MKQSPITQRNKSKAKHKSLKSISMNWSFLFFYFFQSDSGLRMSLPVAHGDRRHVCV